MKIIFVESPKKAKTIYKFIGKDFIVIPTYGHILDLPKNEFGIYLNGNKLEAKYVLRNIKFIYRIKKFVSKAYEIILATDPDREGEFIAWSIAKFIKNKNIHRIRFFEISPKAILKALQNKEEINQNLVNAQKARRFLDRIIGYSLSPLLWKAKIGASAGRVQSATLRLIVEREIEIQNFIPKKFYELEIDFGKLKAYLLSNKGIYQFPEEQKLELEKIKNLLKNKEFTLKEIKKQNKIIKKPTPIDTALLQRIAFLKYKFSAPLTMKMAQSLYEKGYITYHRTDSFNLSKDFLNKVENKLGDYYENPLKIHKRFSQEAHEAIRPVYLTKNLPLDDLEKRLYNLIFDFTLSACSKNAICEEIKFLLNPDGYPNYIFEAKGEKLLYDGFLKFYPFKVSFKELPEIEIGARLKPLKINLLEKTTRPPSRYTESSLIKKLKELGIGRPSTYSEIIKILYKREYVIKTKNYLRPTEKGIKVVEFLKNKFDYIIDLKFTANMENNLDKISLGKLNYESFIIDFWKKLKNIL